MNLAFHIARRYLFAKKSHNAINIISAISALGVCIGTMAIVCVLSVFNGFGDTIQQLFSVFDPELKIELTEGKAFNTHTPEWNKVRQMNAIACFDEVIEDNAMLHYKERQVSAVIKGVGESFTKMVQIDSILLAGDFTLYDGAFHNGVMGIGLAGALNSGVKTLDPITIYVPKRTGRIDLVNPQRSFNTQILFLSGIFSIKQAIYDDNLLIVSDSLARQLFEYNDSTATSVELMLKKGMHIKTVQKEIAKELGSKFKVLDRREQQSDYLRIQKIEKWVTYLILSFILLIAVFNIIGSLSMLIIDKQNDIVTLRNLGADDKLVRRIFLFEGWLISAAGAVMGLILGIALCLGQAYFGWIKLNGANVIIPAYPVKVEWMDVALTLITVLVMGFFAALYPVRHLASKENKPDMQ